MFGIAMPAMPGTQPTPKHALNRNRCRGVKGPFVMSFKSIYPHLNFAKQGYCCGRCRNANHGVSPGHSEMCTLELIGDDELKSDELAAAEAALMR